MAMYIDSDFSEIEKMLMMIVNFMFLINTGLNSGCGGFLDNHGFFVDDEERSFPEISSVRKFIDYDID